MGFEGEAWRLVRQKELVGEIVIEETDFPWLCGRFLPGPALPDLEPLFERTVTLSDAEDWEEFDVVYEKIRQAVSLVAPGGPVAEFLLHIQDGRAWFRWSDELFDDN
ncbi:hypothetical protein [Kitasatospora sp. GP82]|uniref:hypothetical protein n=1 Tax=Kitasatospora sp. GP82 TaxID=3035089 RepID=UPI0024736217|nr:hypothetical protein [Kitasatospora sp. GP82]MDH6129955.1 hypothetical protein [Kitasatospora sp. GP82]